MKSLKELQSLEGKWVLITGGAGHVGIAAAHGLIELGANVVLLDISKASLIDASNTLPEGRSGIVVCDLAENASIREAVAKVEELTAGKLTCIINNAAFVGTSNLKGWCVPFENQSLDTFKSCLDVNLSAPFYLTQQLMPLMENTDGDKSIINISSIYGVVGPQMDLYEGTGMGNPAAYAASKAGLMQLTKWMASVLAPNVRVNSLVLGGIYRGQDLAFLEKYNARVPLNRMATEEDVKGAIAYLATGLSAYMTGQSITLDGGWTCV